MDNKPKKRKGGFLITIGLLTIIAALGLVGYNVWDAKRAEVQKGIAERQAAFNASMDEARAQSEGQVRVLANEIAGKLLA